MPATSGPIDAWPDATLDEHIHAHASGEAFGVLVGRYRERVFRLVVSILGQEFAADAEDVAQEVFVRAHQALGSFRADAAFSTWLYRIAFNHALNVKTRMRYSAPHLTTEVLDRHHSRMPSPDMALDVVERQRVVTACMQELPEVYQSALRLHYWLGASMAEIAAMLDAPENTIKSYLHRARKLMHTMLTQRGFHV